jgi:hypothetical protein
MNGLDIKETIDTHRDKDVALNILKLLLNMEKYKISLRLKFTYPSQKRMFNGMVDEAAIAIYSKVKANFIKQLQGGHDFQDEIKKYNESVESAESGKVIPIAGKSPRSQANRLIRENAGYQRLILALRAARYYKALLSGIINLATHLPTIEYKETTTDQMNQQADQLATDVLTRQAEINAATAAGEPIPKQTTPTKKTAAPQDLSVHIVGGRAGIRLGYFVANFRNSLTGNYSLEQGEKPQEEFIQTITKLSDYKERIDPHSSDLFKKVLTGIVKRRQRGFMDSLAGSAPALTSSATKVGRLISFDPPALQQFLVLVDSLPDNVLTTGNKNINTHRALACYLIHEKYKQQFIIDYLSYFAIRPADLEGAYKKMYNDDKSLLLNKVMNTALKEPEITAMVKNTMDAAQFAEFTSNAGNIYRKPAELFKVWILFTSGVSALNAFMQALASLFKSKDRMDAQFMRDIVRFIVFAHVADRAFENLSGMVWNNKEEGIIRRFLKQTDTIQLTRFFHKEPLSAQETVFTIGKYLESAIPKKEGQKEKISNEFLDVVIFATNKSTSKQLEWSVFEAAADNTPDLTATQRQSVKEDLAAVKKAGGQKGSLRAATQLFLFSLALKNTEHDGTNLSAGDKKHEKLANYLKEYNQ